MLHLREQCISGSQTLPFLRSDRTSAVFSSVFAERRSGADMDLKCSVRTEGR